MHAIESPYQISRPSVGNEVENKGLAYYQADVSIFNLLIKTNIFLTKEFTA